MEIQEKKENLIAVITIELTGYRELNEKPCRMNDHQIAIRRTVFFFLTIHKLPVI